MCDCYDRLLVKDQKNTPISTYCSDISIRNDFIYVMQSLGAVQIGGKVGKIDASIAWSGYDKFSKLRVTSFTVPLRPSKYSGLTYPQIPLIIKEVLVWQGLISNDKKKDVDQWPRVNDFSSLLVWSNPAEVSLQKSINVPIIESSLLKLKRSRLPPLWDQSSKASFDLLKIRKEVEQPLFWIRLCLFLIMLICLLEYIISI